MSRSLFYSVRQLWQAEDGGDGLPCARRSPETQRGKNQMIFLVILFHEEQAVSPSLDNNVITPCASLVSRVWEQIARTI